MLLAARCRCAHCAISSLRNSFSLVKRIAIGARFAIRSIPTLALFRGGRELARQPGAMGAADIVRWASDPPAIITLEYPTSVSRG